MMKRLPGLALIAAIVGLLVGPWMVQAQNPAQRVIIMDATGTHAATVSSGNALSTSAAVTVDTISHITSKTHIVGSVQLTNQAGAVVTVTGTSLDVNCTGCSAASSVTVSHVASALHLAGTIGGAQLHVQGLGIPGQAHGGVLTIQGVAGGVAVPISGTITAGDAVNVFHQSTIRHISSVTHIQSVGRLGTDSHQGGAWNVSAAQSGSLTVQAAHQGGEWTVAHVSGAVHVAAIAQPIHVVGVSIVNSTFPLTCHSSLAFHTSARATTLAHANSGMKIYICGLLLIMQSADQVSIVEGQGTACGTGRTELIGHTTAALSLPATGGFSTIQPFPWINSKTAGNAVCLVKGNATAHVSGVITYRGAS